MTEPKTVKAPDAPQTRFADTVRLSAEGVAKVLGDLEARVIRVVWKLERPASARVVHERVVAEHPVAIHTVITVLNKLVAKGLLSREKEADVFHYRAILAEGEFLAQTSRRLVEGILSLGPDAVAASFVDVMAERDPERLGALMERIRLRIAEEADGDA